MQPPPVASSIPNLLGAQTGRRERGRAGRGRRPGARPGGAAISEDADVQATDADAAISRLSAVRTGYLDDPFAEFFVPAAETAAAAAGAGAPPRRLPIINRGTYARTMALDRLVDGFLAGGDPAGGPRQIVSLGAGTDTRGLRLLSRASPAAVYYHEVDFPNICARKLRTVRAVPALGDVLRDATAVPTGPDHDETGIGGGGSGNSGSSGSSCSGSFSWTAKSRHGGEYWCHGLDLRGLGPGRDSALPGLRPDVPTLLLSECCLCYLTAAQASDVVGWFAARIPAAGLGLVLYEPIRPGDAFGRVMASNLAMRRIRMPTLELYPEPADQAARLRALLRLDGDDGVGGVGHSTVDEVWDRWISAAERERVDGLEGLDEVEEWRLLARHYIVAWGWRGEGAGGLGGLGLDTLPAG